MWEGRVADLELASAATWASAVQVPCPMSTAPMLTRKRPSVSASMRASEPGIRLTG